MTRSPRRFAVPALASLLLAACNSGSPPPGYTLGGTVAGLQGSGLVLANGDDRATVTAGGTSFSMPAPLARGDAYAVTVATQPDGQTCSVANGTGTVAQANVLNVVVTCATTAVSVGGSVTGLTAAGLVLANGDDTVAVPSGATTFALPRSVARTGSYAITVRTQPTGLACQVTHASGVAGDGDVTDVAVACSPAAHALGGTLTGLTAGGLVLANGSDVVAVRPGASSFTLPGLVAEGASWSVGVQAQPAGLLCTVGQGSGTMGVADVADVAVACQPDPMQASYTLGGTITGLTLTGLVLANGSDTLAVAANATMFTMPTAVHAGAPYAVTVQSNPAWVRCTLTGDTGTMPASAWSGVAVGCGQWAPVTTIAGTSGVTGFADGTGPAASFSHPFGIAMNAQGDLFVGDLVNNLIRRVTQAGLVTTFAGTTTHGTADGIGAAAGFYAPSGVAIDASDNLYVVDRLNYTIRKITPAGVVTTLAGSAGSPGAANGTGTAASFSPSFYGVAVDSGGNVFVADMSNNQVRKITPAGVVTTFAGSSTPGSADGNGASASFNSPAGIAVDAQDNVYVSEVGNHAIRKITPAGDVTTIAGAGSAGNTDGTGAAAKFNQPYGLAVDRDGTIYVADTLGNKIRRVTQAGVVTTLVGSTTSGHADANGTLATLYLPTGIAIAPNGDLWIADYNNNLIRKVTR